MSRFSKRFILILLQLVPVSLIIVLLAIIPSETLAENKEIRKFWSSGAHFTWISKISGSLDSISIIIDGKPAASDQITINNYNGSIHMRILLHKSSNAIDIKEGSKSLFSADVLYEHSYESMLVPDGYKYNPFHTTENEKHCLQCHRLSVKEGDMKPARPADSICFQCHKDKFADIVYQHSVAGVLWECLRCHQAEAMDASDLVKSRLKYIIKEGSEVGPLCYQCHEKRETEDSENEYVHGPIAMGECLVCHNPHGSGYKNFLQRDISTLCIECHEMQDMMQKPNIHAPVVKKGCPACHDPHGSNFPYFFAAETVESCFKCHPKIKKKLKDHPVNNHPASGPKNPLDPGEKFTCLSCHDPHASQFDLLLAEEEVMMLCIKCHPVGK